MNHRIAITIGFFFSFCEFATAQNTWIQKANYPIHVSGTVGFSIDDKGFMGLGWNPSQTNTFWQYDPLTNTWLQKANFPGIFMGHSVGFTINNKGYIGTGISGSNPTFHNEFWQYDSINDTWTQKANYGGTPRSEATGFTINGKGYIGTGWSQTSGYKKDFWEYDPTNDQWISKMDFPGTPRNGAVGFSINGKGYIGLGSDATGFKSDLWEYDPISNQWTQKANFPDARARVSCFIIDNICYLGTGWANSGLKNDFWKYNASDDSWTQIENAGPFLRQNGVAFTINNKGYIGTGALYGTPYYNDFWEFAPDSELVIQELTHQNFNIYPNPFKSEITIFSEVDFENLTLKMYNSVGQLIKELLNLNGKNVILYRENLKPGVYFIQLSQNGKSTTTHKIVLIK